MLKRHSPASFSLARVVIDERGLAKGAPAGARRVLFLNQALANLLHLIRQDEIREFSLRHDLMEQVAHALIQHRATAIGNGTLNRCGIEHLFELLGQHLVLLGPLFGDDRLDDFSKCGLVAPYAGLDKAN